MMQAEAEIGAPNPIRTVDRLRAKKRPIVITLIVLVVLGVIFIGWQHFRHKKLINNVTAPTNSQLAAGEDGVAKKALDQKNYKTAAIGYIASASLAQSSKNYDQAKSILETAISKIPDDQTPYTIYDSLYGVAVAQKDKQLEISSLKKALAKAQQPNSGAPAGLTDFYQQQLKSLGQ